MARPRLNTVNFVYTAVGLAVAGGIGAYVYRRLRNRRFEGAQGSAYGQSQSEGQSEGGLMDLRRQTRKAARGIKETVTAGRGRHGATGSDTDSFEDANSSGRELIAETGTTGSTSGASGNASSGSTGTGTGNTANTTSGSNSASSGKGSSTGSGKNRY